MKASLSIMMGMIPNYVKPPRPDRMTFATAQVVRQVYKDNPGISMVALGKLCKIDNKMATKIIRYTSYLSGPVA